MENVYPGLRLFWRQQAYFKSFALAHDTLCWLNGLDLAPEFLFFQTFKNDPEWRAQFVAWGYLKANIIISGGVGRCRKAYNVRIG